MLRPQASPRLMFHSEGKGMNAQTTATRQHCLLLALLSLEARGSQNSTSTCMRQGCLHNQVPVLPERTAVVIKEVLIREEEL